MKSQHLTKNQEKEDSWLVAEFQRFKGFEQFYSVVKYGPP